MEEEEEEEEEADAGGCCRCKPPPCKLPSPLSLPRLPPLTEMLLPSVVTRSSVVLVA
jgi:hypothetical protein